MVLVGIIIPSLLAFVNVIPWPNLPLVIVPLFIVPFLPYVELSQTYVEFAVSKFSHNMTLLFQSIHAEWLPEMFVETLTKTQFSDLVEPLVGVGGTNWIVLFSLLFPLQTAAPSFLLTRTMSFGTSTS